MIQLFHPDSVIIVRKKGDEFIREDICTSPVLPNHKNTARSVRAAAVARLRKDPSTIFVLDDKNGRCEEKFSYRNFVFTLSVLAGEKPSARLQINYGADPAYDEIFDKTENEYGDVILVSDLVNTIIEILEAIEQEDYSFVDDACPSFEKREPEEEVDSLYGIAKLLEECQYQVERLHTINYASQPCLFVHENDLFMIGESHFYGNFFVEMKRVFQGVLPNVVESAIQGARKGHYCMDCFRYNDGSWAFRTSFSDDVYKSNFEKILNEAITSLRDVVEKVEAYEGVGPEVFNTIQEQRSLFVYEVIDASLKLSQLSI